MAWIYLAASEDSPSHSANGSVPSHTVKSTPMLELCCCREWLMADYLSHQSGMTLHRLTGPCYQVESTSFTEGSPAKTSVLRELERAWQASEADYFSRWSGSWKKFVPSGFFWRTSRPFVLADFERSSTHLPIFGMTVGGLVSLPQKLEPAISESAGLCLPTIPTLTAQSYGYNQTDSPSAKRRLSLNSMARRGTLPTPMARDWKGSGGHRYSPDLPYTMGGSLNPQFVEEIMGYPTEWTALKDWAMQWFHFRQR